MHRWSKTAQNQNPKTRTKNPTKDASNGRFGEYEDRVQDDIDSGYYSMANNVYSDDTNSIGSNITATANSLGLKTIEDDVRGFAESSKILMSLLDDVARIHPFVAVAVLAFKGVVALELKRRDNDKKVIALHLQMQEMMAVLLPLRSVHAPDKEASDRMLSLMETVANDIKNCGNVCDTYSKKGLLVKILKGPIYESRLAHFVTTFKDRQKEIRNALILNTALNLDVVMKNLSEVDRTVRENDEKLSMILLFRMLDSPAEKELIQKVQSNGGPSKCMQDDKMLLDLNRFRRTLEKAPPLERASVIDDAHPSDIPWNSTLSSRPQGWNEPTERAGSVVTDRVVAGNAVSPSGFTNYYTPPMEYHVPPWVAFSPNHPPILCQSPQSRYVGSHTPGYHNSGDPFRQDLGQSLGLFNADMIQFPNTPPYWAGTSTGIPLSSALSSKNPLHRPSQIDPVPGLTWHARNADVAQADIWSPRIEQNNSRGNTANDGNAAHNDNSFPKQSSPDDLTLRSLKTQLSEDLEQSLEKNKVLFERKLDMQTQQLSMVLSEVVQQGYERVIAVVSSGPYDRIIDPDLRIIWKEMDWKRSVKAKDFVFALHEYFSEKYSNADTLLPTSKPQNLESFKTARRFANKKVVDRWALDYINLRNIQPILEAFDEDGSGFISIAEVNRLSSATPSGWSLAHWVSYWAVGWHHTMWSYKGKICGVILNMFRDRSQLLPTNRALVDEYLDHAVFDDLLVLLWCIKPFGSTVLNDDLRKKTLEYAQKEELRMEHNLLLMTYQIDTASTLTLITGPGRIERHIFPFLFLILRHHSRILNLASRVVLDRNEFTAAAETLQQVMAVAEERVHDLEAVFRYESASKKDRRSLLKKYAIGMLSDLGVRYDPAPPLNDPNLDGAYQDMVQPDLLKVDILRYPCLPGLDLSVYDNAPGHPVVHSLSPPLAVDPLAAYRQSYPSRATNIARTRWLSAYAAVVTNLRIRRERWSWNHFKNRFADRKRCTELFRRQYLSDPLDDTDVQDLVHYERTLSPADIRFYRSIAANHYDKCIHRGLECATCGRRIVGGRFLIGPESFSFCYPCFRHRTELDYSPTVVFPVHVHIREIMGLLAAADIKVATSSRPKCNICLSEPRETYWVCVHCSTPEFILCAYGRCGESRSDNIKCAHQNSHPLVYCFKNSRPGTPRRRGWPAYHAPQREEPNAPPGFSRPIDPLQGFSPFHKIKIDTRDMEETGDELPPIPLALQSHDVYYQDWIRFMRDLSDLWKTVFGSPQSPPMAQADSTLVELINLWNTRFFVGRGVEVVLFKDNECVTGPNAGTIDQSIVTYQPDSSYINLSPRPHSYNVVSSGSRTPEFDMHQDERTADSSEREGVLDHQSAFGDADLLRAPEPRIRLSGTIPSYGSEWSFGQPSTPELDMQDDAHLSPELDIDSDRARAGHVLLPLQGQGRLTGPNAATAVNLLFSPPRSVTRVASGSGTPELDVHQGGNTMRSNERPCFGVVVYEGNESITQLDIRNTDEEHTRIHQIDSSSSSVAPLEPHDIAIVSLGIDTPEPGMHQDRNVAASDERGQPEIIEVGRAKSKDSIRADRYTRYTLYVTSCPRVRGLNEVTGSDESPD